MSDIKIKYNSLDELLKSIGNRTPSDKERELYKQIKTATHYLKCRDIDCSSCDVRYYKSLRKIFIRKQSNYSRHMSEFLSYVNMAYNCKIIIDSLHELNKINSQLEKEAYQRERKLAYQKEYNELNKKAFTFPVGSQERKDTFEERNNLYKKYQTPKEKLKTIVPITIFGSLLVALFGVFMYYIGWPILKVIGMLLSLPFQIFSSDLYADSPFWAFVFGGLLFVCILGAIVTFIKNAIDSFK